MWYNTQKVYKVNKLSTENKELYGSVKPTEISKLILESEKIIIFKASEEDTSLHKKTVSELKDAVWKKYNY